MLKEFFCFYAMFFLFETNASLIRNSLYFELVLEIRKKYSKLRKEKIKVLLNKLCKQHNIPTIFASSIGNIIKMLKEERKLNHEYARRRITINGRSGELIVKEIKKKNKEK